VNHTSYTVVFLLRIPEAPKEASDTGGWHLCHIKTCLSVLFLTRCLPHTLAQSHSAGLPSPRMHDDSLLIGVGTGLAVVGLCSIPASTGFVAQLIRREPKSDVYEDVDGKATAETVKAFSAKLPKALILLLAAAGCAVSIAHAILSKGVEDLFWENWLVVGAWVCLTGRGGGPALIFLWVLVLQQGKRRHAK
jgi:hypothetical protein